MSEEWCRQQLMNLQIKDRRLDTLNEIRNHLTKLPAEQVASVSSNFLTISELFDCVEDNQERYPLTFILSFSTLSLAMLKIISEMSNQISLVIFCRYV